MARTPPPATASVRSGYAKPSPYAGQDAVLATMHGKHVAITPALREGLGLRVEAAAGLDTDALGTFTGEMPRTGSMREAAIAKARLGMTATGRMIGIASEGSYGPHPLIPFMAGGIELMVLVDDARGIVITEQCVEDAPVYGHALATCVAELGSLLANHRFPEHALIVKANTPASIPTPIHKGVRDLTVLTNAIIEAATASTDGKALVQTDMRAHMNPLRMQSIARVARKLAARAAVLCPACTSPGYGQVDIESGLPCAHCDTPTDLLMQLIDGCCACRYRECRLRPDGRSHADPGYCPRCNP